MRFSLEFESVETFDGRGFFAASLVDPLVIKGVDVREAAHSAHWMGFGETLAQVLEEAVGEI